MLNLIFFNLASKFAKGWHNQDLDDECDARFCFPGEPSLLLLQSSPSSACLAVDSLIWILHITNNRQSEQQHFLTQSVMNEREKANVADEERWRCWAKKRRDGGNRKWAFIEIWTRKSQTAAGRLVRPVHSTHVCCFLNEKQWMSNRSLFFFFFLLFSLLLQFKSYYDFHLFAFMIRKCELKNAAGS